MRGKRRGGAGATCVPIDFRIGDTEPRQLSGQSGIALSGALSTRQDGTASVPLHARRAGVRQRGDGLPESDTTTTARERLPLAFERRPPRGRSRA